MSFAGGPGHCACRESHPRQWAAQLRCRRPSREELTDGLDGLGELIGLGAESLGAARPGQRSAPGIACEPLLPVSGRWPRPSPGGGAGQRDRSLQISRLRTWWRVRPGTLPWRANRARRRCQDRPPRSSRQEPVTDRLWPARPGNVHQVSSDRRRPGRGLPVQGKRGIEVTRSPAGRAMPRRPPMPGQGRSAVPALPRG